MVSVDKSVIARYRKENKVFEILVDCDKAVALREGQQIPIDDILAYQGVFSDSGKGLKAAETDMQKAFGTTNYAEVARKIILHGEVQLTTEHRKRLREEKERQIMTIIHRNYIDPRTNAPHPMTRLENAFAEAKVHIDEFKPAESQVQEIVRALQPIMPLRYERSEISAKIPPVYAGKSYSVLKSFGLKKEEWLNDGSLLAIVEVPSGMKQDFIDRLNSITHGNAEVEIKSIK